MTCTVAFPFFIFPSSATSPLNFLHFSTRLQSEQKPAEVSSSPDVGEVTEFPFQPKGSSLGSSFLLASSIRRGRFPVMCSGPWPSSQRRQAPFLAVITPEKATAAFLRSVNRELGSGRGGCFAIPGQPRSWLSSLSRGCFPWPAAFQEGAEDRRRWKAALAARRAAGGSLPLVRTAPAALFPARPRGGDRRAEGAEPVCR